MAAGKRTFKITTPRSIRVQTANGNAELKWSGNFGSQKSEAFSEAQSFVDSECLRYCDPLTPRLTGMLIKSGELGSVIGSGELKYLAPYARKQYYENKGKGQRGGRWFERMKASKKETIRKGAAQIIGK